MRHLDTLALAPHLTSSTAMNTLVPGETGGGPGEALDRWLYVISGRGRVTVDDHSVELKDGALLLIQAGEPHHLEALGPDPLITLNCSSPPEF